MSKPDGPPITTWRGLHASGAFADPVRDAVAEAYAAVKKAEDLVRERYLANTNGDAAALREVLSQLVQAGVYTHKAGEAWKPHEYPPQDRRGEGLMRRSPLAAVLALAALGGMGVPGPMRAPPEPPEPPPPPPPLTPGELSPDEKRIAAAQAKRERKAKKALAEQAKQQARQKKAT